MILQLKDLDGIFYVRTATNPETKKNHYAYFSSKEYGEKYIAAGIDMFGDDDYEPDELKRFDLHKSKYFSRIQKEIQDEANDTDDDDYDDDYDDDEFGNEYIDDFENWVCAINEDIDNAYYEEICDLYDLVKDQPNDIRSTHFSEYIRSSSYMDGVELIEKNGKVVMN